MQETQRRKICVPITSRAYYGRLKSLLDILQRDPSVDLQIIVGGSILLDKYGKDARAEIESRFPIERTLFNVIEGGNHIAMAKTACLTALEMTNALYASNPDIVLIHGDRYEQLAAAMSAAFLNKTIVHIEGGDLSGNIDESVRHAITKLAHYHFVTSEDAYRRVVRMGEHPRTVYHVGSLDVENIKNHSHEITNEDINVKAGAGAFVDITKPFLMVIQHPVTSDPERQNSHTNITLRAVAEMNMPTVWFWPNADAGTADVAEAIRHFRENGIDVGRNFRFLTDLPTDQFVALLKKSSCLVGNSSAGIKECSYLGKPVVNIGTRQQNRLRGPNVIDVGYDKDEIKSAIKKQLAHGPYPKSDIYYKENTHKEILDILKRIDLYIQKNFYEA